MVDQVKDLDPRNQYTATAGQTIFPYTFPIFDKDDLVVIQEGATLTEGTDYTVSGVGDEDGGNVTLTTGATVDDTITIYRDIAIQRLVDYQDSGDFLASDVNDDFDRQIMIDQQLEQRINRCIQFAQDDTASTTTLANIATRGGKLLGFDSSTGEMVYSSIAASTDDYLDVPDVATMKALTGLTAGVSVVTTKEFSSSSGGGGTYDVISGTGTANGYDIIAHDTLSLSFVLRINGNVDVSQLGAVLDGSDETAILNRALTIATPSATATFFATSGGKSVYIPEGTLGVNSEVVVPEWVNLHGAGKGLTVIKLLSSGAAIRYGTKSGAFGAAERGGESGGFTINGNDVSSLALHIGFVVERDFKDIDVINSLGDGCLVEAAQNCNFFGCGFQHNGADSGGTGSNIKLDYGAGNIRFWGTEVNRPGKYNIEFVQSGTSPVGGFSVPTDVRFIGCMIERWEDADGTGLVEALGTIYHGAGRLNRFDGCDISATGLPSAFDVVTVRKDGAGASTELYFHNCGFHGTASQSTAFDVDDAVTVVLTGRNFFENHAKVFEVGDNAAVIIESSIQDSSGGTFFTAKGSKTQDQLVFRKVNGIIEKYDVSAAGSVAMAVTVSGEANPRWEFKGNEVKAGPGSSATDVTLARETAAGQAAWALKNHIKVNGTAATITAGTGVPTIGLADGSIFLRTDGGSGTTFYVRESGAWVAK